MHVITLHGLEEEEKSFAYKLTGCFDTAIFLKFRIYLTILLKEILFGIPESSGKMAAEVGQYYYNVYIQETQFSEMFLENVLLKYDTNIH